MKTRARSSVLPLFLAAAALAAGVGCGAEDGTTLGARRSSPTGDGGGAAASEPEDPGATGAPGGGSPAGASGRADGGAQDPADASSVTPDAGSPGDAGTTTPDAGGDATAPPADNAFTGAPAYTARLGGSALAGEHNFQGNTPTTNPAKQACLSCHRAGGGAPAFAVGGTVFKDAAGTTPAPNVEVRLRDSAGNAVSVFTDNQGNFYRRSAVTLPAHVGARDGTATRPMSAPIANGNCNASTCHGGPAGWIHVP